MNRLKNRKKITKRKSKPAQNVFGINFSSLLKAVENAVEPIVVNNLRSLGQNIHSTISDFGKFSVKKVIDELIFGLTLFAGFIFVAVGVALWFSRYFGVNSYVGYLFVGATLLLVSALMRARVESGK